MKYAWDQRASCLCPASPHFPFSSQEEDRGSSACPQPRQNCFCLEWIGFSKSCCMVLYRQKGLHKDIRNDGHLACRWWSQDLSWGMSSYQPRITGCLSSVANLSYQNWDTPESPDTLFETLLLDCFSNQRHLCVGHKLGKFIPNGSSHSMFITSLRVDQKCRCCHTISNVRKSSKSWYYWMVLL